MNLKVGMSVALSGRSHICTSIIHSQETLFARANSLQWREDQLRIGNQKIMQLEIDEFAENDVVEVEFQRIELTEPGKNIFFIYPFYKVKLARRDEEKNSIPIEGSKDSES